MKPSRLELDYVASAGRSRWPGLLLLALALGVSAQLVERYRDVQRETAQWTAVHGLIKTDRPTAAPVPLPEGYAEQAKAAEAIVRQLALPWAKLIGAMEDAATKDVAVLQVQPEAPQQLLRITAEARNQNAMLEFVGKLAASGALTNVHWTNHQVQAEDPQRPLQFSVQASFRSEP